MTGRPNRRMTADDVEREIADLRSRLVELEGLLEELGGGPRIVNASVSRPVYRRLKAHCVTSRQQLKAVVEAALIAYLDQEGA
ncbi:MAG: hypothetical protein ACRD0J_08690 [Acidimicrobiales bacterium]